MREAIIEKYLVRQVAAVGGIIRKVSWLGRRGAPDRLVLLEDGRNFWVELKATGERPTMQQLAEHERMRAYGCTVVVVDSLDGVDKLLKEDDDAR